MLLSAQGRPSRLLGSFRSFPFTSAALSVAARRCQARAHHLSKRSPLSSWSPLRGTRGTPCAVLPTGRRWATNCETAAFEPNRGPMLVPRRTVHSAAASAAKPANEADDTAVVETVSASSATTLQRGESATARAATAAATGAAAAAESQNTDATGDQQPSKSTTAAAIATVATPAGQASMWRRAWRVFKSEGTDFSIFYLPFYGGTFVFFYFAFAMGLMRKEAILDYVLSWMGDRVDRAKLNARIAAWNSWANLGFAIAINELVEVARLPVVFALYYVMRPHSNHFARWLAGLARRMGRGKWTDGAAKV
ncbi:hypothetical protein conserved [Leishmania donovani]|nr:hypothetical protein conserved [Leishmania donovani]VDZ48054.1 hypothetical_protein_conserved [Leishmania donovani]